MMKCNNEYALKTAIELAKVNIDSTEKWIEPDHVNAFIKEVYDFLTGETESKDE